MTTKHVWVKPYILNALMTPKLYCIRIWWVRNLFFMNRIENLCNIGLSPEIYTT